LTAVSVGEDGTNHTMTDPGAKQSLQINGKEIVLAKIGEPEKILKLSDRTEEDRSQLILSFHDINNYTVNIVSCGI
jgi:hypothetical protein